MAKAKRYKTEKSENRTKLSLGWKIAISVLSVILALVIAAISLFFYYFGGLKTTKLTGDSSELGIESATEEKTAALDITNIALFGVDSRNNDDTGRSDALMIMSVDKTHGKIKLTSIARDTRVYIPDRGYEKITHAYAYGGAALAIKTLNTNFKTNIKEYVTINFDQLATVINSLGGVTVTISEAERLDANIHILALGTGTAIPRSGTVLLTGEQAVGYARVRDVGGDSMRTQRQRIVLGAIFEKMKGRSALEYADFVRTMLPNVETSLDYSDLIGLSTIMFGSVVMEEMAFPNDNSNARGGIFYSDGLWYWEYDLDTAAQQLHTFIYEDGEEAVSSASE